VTNELEYVAALHQ